MRRRGVRQLAESTAAAAAASASAASSPPSSSDSYGRAHHRHHIRRVGVRDDAAQAVAAPVRCRGQQNFREPITALASPVLMAVEAGQTGQAAVATVALDGHTAE
jgi:hypothetical protein